MSLRSLPKVDEVLRWPALLALEREVGRVVLRNAVRAAIAQRRQAILAGTNPDGELDAAAIEAEVRAAAPRSLRRVINATGVVLHTNLGRAPLAASVLEQVAQLGAGYSNLELDLDTGERGSRHVHATAILRELLAVEGALVVNNCAAAVLLALGALANGKPVIVSRGELIEIGGAFRVPDIMRQSGAILVEIGTTNRTHARDYAAAITPDTALLLKVHRSNFALVGFQAEATVSELAAIARERQIPLVVDLGSGGIVSSAELGLSPPEPTIGELLRDGADLVLASGDKLLGGPQAGILVGKQALIDRCAAHPLMRALRPSKLTFAALTATLELYRTGKWRELPTLAALAIPEADLQARAERLVKELRDPPTAVTSEAVRLRSLVGGGSMPLCEPWSWGLQLHATAIPANALLATLRAMPLPVIGRIVDDHVVLDLRTVGLDEEPDLLHAIRSQVT